MLGKNRKIRVIVNGVAIYTTVGKAIDTFCTTLHRNAVAHCLRELQKDQPKPKGTISFGLATTFQGVQVQIDALPTS